MNLVTLLLLAGAGVGGPVISRAITEPYTQSYLLFLESETVDIRKASPGELATTESARLHRFIVKYDHPPQNLDRCYLKASGLTIEGYLPYYAYLVTGNQDTVESLLKQGVICWASLYLPNWKVSPLISDGFKHSDTLHLWLFDDAEIEKVASSLRDDFGAVLYSIHDGLNKTLLLSVDEAYLSDIAALDEVRWMERFYSPVYHNDQCQWVVQSWRQDNRSLWDRGIDGSGVVVSTGDSGIRTSHVMYRDSTVSVTEWGDFPDHRKIIAYWPSNEIESAFGDMSSVGYHGTHTGATVCGDDSYWGKNSAYDGMAPGARLYFVDNGGNFTIAYPADYNDMYHMPWQGNEGGRAKLMSNSWGSGGGNRNYDLPCRQTDEFVWNHPDFLVLYSAGNSGSSGVSPPSTAKNVVCVGATMNGSGASIPTGFSSIGPTSDGRIKPAVTAPGVLYSADGATSDGYKSAQGTSMSCPAVAGACALIIQYLYDGWYPTGAPDYNRADSINPSAALLKAMLITSALADYPSYPIPDPKIGWGRVCVDSVLYFSGENMKLYLHDNTLGLETGEEAIYNVEITGDEWPLRVTLVWSDPPAEMSVSKKLVNDLDLEVTSPSGGVFLGNVFSSSYSETGGYKDETNVEECARIKDPEPGTWKITVRAANVPVDIQPYAVVITGMIETNQPEFTANGIRIDDTGASLPNQALDPGEDVVLYPRLKNRGEIDAENVKVRLSCDDSLLTVIDQQWVTYGSMQPEEILEGEGFEVILDAATPSDAVLPVVATVKVNGGALLDTVNYPIVVGISGVEAEADTGIPTITCPGLIGDGSVVNLNLPRSEKVSVEIYDVSGRTVDIVIKDKFIEAGNHSVQFAENLPHGVYFIGLKTESYSRTLKAVLLK